jgi:hypothetical protein
MNALSALLGSKYSLSFNNIAYKIKFSNSVNFFVILYEKTTMNKFLGISYTENTSCILQSRVYSITSPYVVNFLPTQKIHLRSSNLKVDSYNNYDKSNDVFLSIQNSTLFGQGIYFNNNTNLKYLIDIKNLSTIDIRITDDKYRLLDLNNVNWYLTFEIEYFYKIIPEKNNLIKFLKNDKFIQNYLQSLEEIEELEEIEN